jgi:hypothetical protein
LVLLKVGAGWALMALITRRGGVGVVCLKP